MSRTPTNIANKPTRIGIRSAEWCDDMPVRADRKQVTRGEHVREQEVARTAARRLTCSSGVGCARVV